MFMNIGKLIRPISKHGSNASFFISQILIPLGVLSLYFVSSSLLLPDGVNKVFVTRSAKFVQPITIFLFIAFIFISGLRKNKQLLFSTAGEKLSAGDLILLLLPLTPVVQFIINNANIISWFEYIITICFFVLIVSLPIFIVPLLFRNTDSFRPVMFMGLSFAFLITNMASLTRQFTWYKEGSLKIQLLVFGGVWFISWLLFKINLRKFLYLLIAVNFASNSFLQLINREGTQSNAVLNQTDNMLVSLIDSREPVITPSIYLLVYDAYVVNETMLAYGIDNRVQEQYLENLDFKIYPQTYSVGKSSIPSMNGVFNSSLSFYGDTRKEVSGDGIVQNLLKKFGYKTYGVFPTDFFFRGMIPSYDYSFPENSFSVRLISEAIFKGEFRFDIGFDDVSEEQFIHERNLIFSEVSEDPKFLYTHSKLPNHSQNSGVCLPNEVKMYGERLTRANLDMQHAIEMIIENDPKSIVIIAGDHGPYLTKNCLTTGNEYEISEISRLDIQDRYGAFLAIRWPSSDFEEYDDITVLQDLFPAIFAYIFADPGLLDSKVEPITTHPEAISGAMVVDGVIEGGIHTGEALFTGWLER